MNSQGSNGMSYAVLGVNGYESSPHRPSKAHTDLAIAVEKLLKTSGCATLEELSAMMLVKPQLVNLSTAEGGSTIEVSGILPVAACPEALQLIPHAWIELLNRELMSPTTIPVNHYDSVITLSVSKEVVAFIIFRENAPGVDYWISLSYTKPEFRRSGYQTRLFEALCAEARKKGFHYIRSGVYVDNKASMANVKAQGRIVRMTADTEFRL